MPHEFFTAQEKVFDKTILLKKDYVEFLVKYNDWEVDAATNYVNGLFAGVLVLLETP